MTELKVIPVETDVLVIGGGLAGCMAAINAGGNKGLRVTLVEKSDTRASGKAGTGVDHAWSYIPPVHEKMGYTLDDMVEDWRQSTSIDAPAFIREDLFRLVASTMYDRMLDLEKFGIKFRYEDSEVPGKFRVVYQYFSVPGSFNFDGTALKPRLTAEIKRRGVQIINRVSISDLVKTGGQICGAVGVGTRTADIYFFKAKAVVLSTGGLTRIHRNPTGVDFNTFGPPACTGDGSSMALHIGLPIVNMESLSGKPHLRAGANYNPNYGDPRNTVQPAARIVDWKGNVLVPRTQFYDWKNLGKEKWTPDIRRKWLEDRRLIGNVRSRMGEMHERGEGPFYLDFTESTDYEAEYIEWSIKNEGRGTQFMRYFKDEEGFDLRKNRQEYGGFGPMEFGTGQRGLWVDKDLETGLRNLFAAGDEIGGFLNSAAAPGALAGGWYAGGMAARRAQEQKEFLPASGEKAKARKEMCQEILNRERGFFWKEVEIYVQNVMDFYCGGTRSEGMLARGLQRLKYAREAPLKAENPHELARALEVKSIMDSAEMVLWSSLERKESRPVPLGFRRADYPEQNDKEWSCFLGIRLDEGQYKFSRYQGNRQVEI
jgi:succinate dehydrogenase/fumarate reductase flavoprotein subunit